MDLVSDWEVAALRLLLVGAILSRAEWQRYLYIIRGMTSLDEVDEILSKANGLGPVRFEDTWDAVTRSDISFWRRPQ